MKTKFEILIPFCVLFLFCNLSKTNAQKITLDASMITQESGGGDAVMLVDEQAVAGDPKGGSGGSVTTPWAENWTAVGGAYIDLGAEYDITDIYMYDGTGSGSVDFQSGTPGSWTSIVTYGFNTYNQWHGDAITVTTRYINIVYPKGFGGCNELVIYGSASGGGCTDTEAPDTPTNLLSSDETENSITLSWDAVSDNGCNGIVSYDVYMDDVFAVNVSSNSTIVSSLTSNTEYTFKVLAKDGEENASGFSNVVTTSTIEVCIDTEAPEIPTGLVASGETENSIKLNWDAVSDMGCDGVVSYDIYQDDAFVSNVSVTYATIEGLAADTEYRFKSSGER